MSVILDIVGAALIVGILMLCIFGMIGNLHQTSYDKVFSTNTQSNAVTLARILESDFVKIGYHVPDSVAAVLTADSTSIAFISDITNTGTLDTIRYYIGSVTDAEPAKTKNPNDRLIFREKNSSSTIHANVGLTSFSLMYFDSTGVATNVRSLIKSIRIKFRVESPTPTDASYTGTFWDKTIFPRNL